MHVHDAACVSVALARAGHVYVAARCLRMLVRWAQDRGLPWVLAQVDADPGLTFLATCDMAMPVHWWLTGNPTREYCGRYDQEGAPLPHIER